MKRISVVALFLVMVLLATTGGVSADSYNHFEAHLSGDNEVPPSGSQATGQAIFRVGDDGTAIEYRLIVANLDNLTQAHIHRGPAGVNAGVVVFLYPSAPPSQLIPGTSNGVVMTGRITAADLRGSLLGAPLSALIAEMAAGNTYVNAHTTAFTGGEIRGQIK